MKKVSKELTIKIPRQVVPQHTLPLSPLFHPCLRHADKPPDAHVDVVGDEVSGSEVVIAQPPYEAHCLNKKRRCDIEIKKIEREKKEKVGGGKREEEGEKAENKFVADIENDDETCANDLEVVYEEKYGLDAHVHHAHVRSLQSDDFIKKFKILKNKNGRIITSLNGNSTHQRHPQQQKHTTKRKQQHQQKPKNHKQHQTKTRFKRRYNKRQKVSDESTEDYDDHDDYDDDEEEEGKEDFLNEKLEDGGELYCLCRTPYDESK